MFLQYERFQTVSPAIRDLLLQADPEWSQVMTYLPQSTGVALSWHHELVGVLVLTERPQRVLEVTNLAVLPEKQRHGIGQAAIHFAQQWGSEHGQTTLRVATGSTSLGPLYLYQKCGLRIVAVEPDYFTQRYSLPIWENGIQLRDRLVLTQALSPENQGS
ncbi:GNAT family N-acetyltransferase [Levilactobacillus acidifarinae]|nr:GNAT family N-acetyltransferase [Levilactobacillus acidifarinae]GEO68428.1 N-acetyltransferase [Levilactobacillus acidifarinae]